MKRKNFKEWEASQKLPFKGITADRLRKIGVKDTEIRKMTIGQADDILNFFETYEEDEPVTKYTCRYCHAPVYKSEVVVADETIICRGCAYGF